MRLTSTGLKHGRSGAHAARTMMFADLHTLLRHCGTKPLAQEAYRDAIIERNCLGKRSAKTRSLSYRHLVDLYGLDSSQLVFAGLLRFWNEEDVGRPLIALCAALARDPLLAQLAPLVWGIDRGAIVSRLEVEGWIDQSMPERFSSAMRKSLAQNINSTLTQSGHLIGRRPKRRVQAKATPAAVAYALLLGYIDGICGPALFQTLYAKALDCSVDEAVAMAEAASRRGLIRFNRIGQVMEVAFPNIVTGAELELVREQD